MNGGFSSSVQPTGRIRGMIPRSAVGTFKDLASGSRVTVEIGAGTGVICGALFRARCDVIAFELCTDSVGHIRRSLPGVDCVQAHPRELPLRPEAVDLVIVNEMSGARDSLRSIRDELRRVLSAQGLVAQVDRIEGDIEGDDETDPTSESGDDDDSGVWELVESHRFDGDGTYVALAIRIWRVRDEMRRT